jgi:hypothetical protein
MVIPGRLEEANPEIHFSQHSCGTMDSGLDASHRPGMTAT